MYTAPLFKKLSQGNVLLILIDESGCAGFKLEKGSTSHFVVAMVIFSNFEEAEKAGVEIGKLQKELNIYPEFKFSKTRSNVKDKFFQAMLKYNFKVRALVVKKNEIYNADLRGNKEAFYSYFLKMLINRDSVALANASVKIDGNADNEFTMMFAAYLRQAVGAGKIRKFKFSDSRKDTLIQLADMVVGAIARNQKENRKDGSRWYDMLGKKIDSVWMFANWKKREKSASVL